MSIMVNDELTIPRYGLYSQAQLTSSRSGPYRILQNESSLTITTQTQTATVELPLGTRVTTDSLVTLFNTALVDKDVIAENVNGHLMFSEVGSLGLQSEITIDGSASTLLGFVVQKRSRGRLLFPGWALHRRLSADGSVSARYPKFSAPVRTNGIFKVNYVTSQSRCRRCASSTVENDWRTDSVGDVILVENENLLHQAALKILLTSKGTNAYFPEYGSSLKSRIGAKAVGAISSILNEDVRRALEIMQRTQAAQARYQTVSPKERLLSIESVQAVGDKNDPTRFYVDVRVVNASQEPVQLTVFYTVGGVSAFVNNVRVF